MWSTSDSAKSCSRMWLPSLSVKLRTQPTWSDGSSFSIADSATTGCQAVWLLKSRRIAQTRSIGASMMAERVTRIIDRAAGAAGLPRRGSTPHRHLQGIEPGLEHALADIAREL